MLIKVSKSQTLEEIVDLLELPQDEILSRAARLGISIVRHADTIERISAWSVRQTKGRKKLSLDESRLELQRSYTSKCSQK